MGKFTRLLLWVLILGGIAYGGYRLNTGGPEAPASATIPAPTTDEARIGRFAASQFLIEHDRFLAATDPAMVPAAEATWLQPSDEVLGVLVSGRARAYPVPMISYHHVVNDVIEGIPIAVTY